MLGHVSQIKTERIYKYIFRTIKASSGELRLLFIKKLLFIYIHVCILLMSLNCAKYTYRDSLVVYPEKPPTIIYLYWIHFVKPTSDTLLLQFYHVPSPSIIKVIDEVIVRCGWMMCQFRGNFFFIVRPVSAFRLSSVTPTLV